MSARNICRRGARTILAALTWTSAVTTVYAQSTPAAANRSFGIDSVAMYPEPVTGFELPSSHRHSAPNAAYDLWFDRHAPRWRQSFDDPRVSGDSIRAGVAARAAAWIAQLGAEAPEVIHLDEAARVNVAAEKDSAAQRLIARRLALPALSMAERAYTLWNAVVMFADTARPARYFVAEEYMTALDRLPDDPGGWYRSRAHAALAEAYDVSGMRSDALRHALATFARLDRFPPQDREDAFDDASTFLIAAHALYDQPSGRRRMDSLVAALRAAATPPPTMAWMVTGRFVAAASWDDSVTRFAGSARLLGAPAPPLVAHVWWNLPNAPRVDTSGADTSAVASAGHWSLGDGTVRLLLFANLYCCVDAIAAAQRLRSRVPAGTEIVLVTATTGYINGVLVPPEEEVRRLERIYRDTVHITLPTALWVGQKRRTSYGGMVPAPNPNLERYSIAHQQYGGQSDDGAPSAVLVDGHGVVRRIFTMPEGLTRADEARMMADITSLVARR